MFATAILFFGILNETGTFTAIITKIAGRFHLTRKNIFLMTVFVSAIAHLSGSGAVSYLIVITTCKSIYNENKIPLTNLMCLSSFNFWCYEYVAMGRTMRTPCRSFKYRSGFNLAFVYPVSDIWNTDGVCNCLYFVKLSKAFGY